LLASVLWLDDGTTRLVLAALDLLMVEPPVARKWRRQVAAAVAVPEAHIFISCTHTHSGPVTSQMVGWRNDPAVPAPDPAYLDWVANRVVEAAKAAAAKTAPAELAWTSADARGVGGNRLAADGITDPECGVLAVRERASRRMLAVSLVYGMHPTVMHEDSTLVSSDFLHYTRQHLRERWHNELTVLCHTAPCGNQSPRYFVKGQTFDEAERLGRKLGVAAEGALQAITGGKWAAEPRLAGVLAAVELPRRAVPAPEAARAVLDEYRATFARYKAEGVPKPIVRTAECAVFGAEGMVALAEAAARGELARLLADYAPLEVQALRIGSAVLIGLPGECLTEHSLAIKQAARMRTFVVSLVNGELQGYIVTPEAEAAGGYEATNGVYAAGSGQVLVQKALELVEKLA
jgi:hypothetical protein